MNWHPLELRKPTVGQLVLLRLRDGLGYYEHGPCRLRADGKFEFAKSGALIEVRAVAWRPA